MLVEATVFGGNHRIPQIDRNVLQRNWNGFTRPEGDGRLPIFVINNRFLGGIQFAGIKGRHRKRTPDRGEHKARQNHEQKDVRLESFSHSPTTSPAFYLTAGQLTSRSRSRN